METTAGADMEGDSTDNRVLEGRGAEFWAFSFDTERGAGLLGLVIVELCEDDACEPHDQNQGDHHGAGEVVVVEAVALRNGCAASEGE